VSLVKARPWQQGLPAVRRQVAEEAAALARPRIWTDTVGGLASTAWRAISVAAPDAPVLLLSAAAAATGAPIAPPDAKAATIARVERLVREGGPAYIKLGQFIASADGLLPPQWVEAFAWCRDDAPRMPTELVRSVIERELGPDALAWLDDEPLAAASIGQVHRARLHDGSSVVVKVRRPGLRRRLRSDIGALALAVPALERLYKDVAAANLGGFIELFAQLTLEELDFRLEAENLVESAAGLEALGLDFVRVPRPVDSMITERVLVMGEIGGVSYDRAATVLSADVDGERMLQLAIGGVIATALLQGLFHGDLHAGNVLVDSDGSFGLVDFGICGRLDAEQRAAVARYLMAFAASDSRAQVAALRDLRALPLAAEDELAEELSAEFERLDRRADGAVTFERLGDTVGRQLRILSRRGFRMPKELVLFFKNLLYLSSLAATLAPGADLFAVIESALADVSEEHSEALAALTAAGA
jgi:ubiquinone biosynthesis protein